MIASKASHRSYRLPLLTLMCLRTYLGLCIVWCSIHLSKPCMAQGPDKDLLSYGLENELKISVYWENRELTSNLGASSTSFSSDNHVQIDLPGFLNYCKLDCRWARNFGGRFRFGVQDQLGYLRPASETTVRPLAGHTQAQNPPRTSAFQLQTESSVIRG